jgi:hypothetical protein
MKLFKANTDLIVKRVAILTSDAFRSVLTSTIETLQKNLPPA